MKRSRMGAAAALAAAMWGIVPAGAQNAPAQPLPLRDVVLFSSGVGYFGRTGRVEGETSLDLQFRAGQLNDVLKSLVLFDPRGQVRPVSYTLETPSARRLRSSGLNLDQSGSLGALIRQFQGARAQVEAGGAVVEGRIVSVSLKAVAVPNVGQTQTEVLNLFTEDGLRALPLDNVGRVKLLDERLDRELRESLEAMAEGMTDQQRAVTLRFAGGQARDVRVGYLQEMPVWKTSYRLALDKKEAPYLQGWAIVENTTEEDWKDVALSLISGRPVSFIQDLSQPLYVPRPVVQAQVIGSPRPQTYAADLGPEGLSALVREQLDNSAMAQGTPPPAASPAASGPAGGGRAGGFGAAETERLARSRRADLNLAAAKMAESVASQAQGTERGALFEYAIQQPVTLARGKAAMVPIVTEKVEAESVSIYDPASDTQHALNGFRLKNSTGLHLAGGPITVFRDGIYAGDAQVGNLQPGEDRLLSYAVDLELVTEHKQPLFRQDTLSVSAKNGVLQIRRKQQRTHEYTFRNKSDEAKVVVIQQAQEPEFKVVQPAEGVERTPNEHRFLLPVPAKGAAALKVVTERPVSETLALTSASMEVLVAYAQNAQVSERLRAALKDLAERRRRIEGLSAERAGLERELKEIDQEQDRIRRNMQQLDRNSPLYAQYVKKLTDQEARVETLRAQIARLRESESAAQKELAAFLETLTID